MKKILLLILSLVLTIYPVLAKEKIELTHDTAGIYVFKIK